MLLKHFVVHFMYLTFCQFVLFCREVQENIDDVYIYISSIPTFELIAQQFLLVMKPVSKREPCLNTTPFTGVNNGFLISPTS